jgi:hypothetical protein
LNIRDNLVFWLVLTTNPRTTNYQPSGIT